MSPKAKMWSIVGGVTAVIVLVSAVFVVAALNDDDSESTNNAVPPTSTYVAPTADPGASGFGTPTTDFIGRKVMIPNNPAGQPLDQKEPGDRGGCAASPAVSPEGVMIQRTFDVSNLFSTSDGPTRIEGDRAVGYRQTPQGAALAAWNIFKRMGVGGDVSEDVLFNQVVMTDEQRQKIESLGPLDGPGIDPAALKYDQAAEAFRIVSCDKDFVSIEYAVIQAGDDKGMFPERRWLGYRMAVVWRDGDWKFLPDGSGLAPAPYTSLGGEWTRWAL